MKQFWSFLCQIYISPFLEQACNYFDNYFFSSQVLKQLFLMVLGSGSPGVLNFEHKFNFAKYTDDQNLQNKPIFPLIIPPPHPKLYSNIRIEASQVQKVFSFFYLGFKKIMLIYLPHLVLEMFDFFFFLYKCNHMRINTILF